MKDLETEKAPMPAAGHHEPIAMRRRSSCTVGSPSEQIAFLQAEVRELGKLLDMAAAVAVQLDRCQQMAEAPRRTPGANTTEKVVDQLIANLTFSVRSAATDIHTNALWKLMQISDVISKQIAQATTLVVDGLAARGPEQEATDIWSAERKHRIESTPSIGDGIGETRRSETPAAGPGYLSLRESHQDTPQTPTPGEPASHLPALREQPSLPAIPARGLLGGWLRALVRFYSASPGRMIQTPSRERTLALPAAGPSSAETRITILGRLDLIHLSTIHDRLTGIPGVREVAMARVSSDSAQLIVRHEAGLDLSRRVESGLDLPIEVAWDRDQPGSLLLRLADGLTEEAV